jgi:membrane fusion protein (multidrug efflux system)
MATTTESESRPSNGHPAPATVVSPPRKRNKALRAYMILGTLAGTALAIYFIRGYLTRDLVSTDDAQVDADVVPVATRVGGVVLNTKVRDNQQVKAGAPITEIDPRDYTAKVAAAQAELDAATAQADATDAQVEIVKSTSAGGLSSAKAQLQGTGASVRSAAAQVQAATAQVAKAQSELAKAEGDLARAKTLHDQGAITAQAYESALSSRDSMRAALDAANANLTFARDQQALAQSRIGEAQGRVQQSAPVDQQIAAATASSRLAHARVEGAKAALEQAKLQLGYTKIVAPTDGYISKLAAHDGQMVQPGTTLVMVVPANSYVIANFKETQIERIRPGQEVDVSIDAISGTFHGVVDSIAAGTGARFSMMPPDNATGNFVKVVQRVPVKIAWTSGQDLSLLHAGLSAEVTVHLK